MGHGRGLSFLGAILIASCLFCPIGVVADENTEDAGTGTDVYTKEFFEKFSPVTAAEMLDRVPGISFILNNGETANRGFGSNKDRILINGRRVSGKENTGQDALERIAADQVERIEVIRTGSTDADNRTTDTQVNIVLKTDGNDTTSTWELSYTRYRGDVLRPGGKLTYSGNWKNVDYATAFKAVPNVFLIRRVEDGGIPNLGLTERLLESEDSFRTDLSVSADLVIDWTERDILRLNGVFTDASKNIETDERFFQILPGGGLISDRREFEDDHAPNYEWEIGGDFEHSFGPSLGVKLLGLHNVSFGDREQFVGDVIAGSQVVTQRLMRDFITSESILRGSVKWELNDRHDVEFGIEGALNKLDSKLQIFRDINGQFVELDLPLGQSDVKETRGEAFITDVWQINSALSLESALFVELSQISQSAEGIEASRTLSFYKPAFDLRYQANTQNQVQISVERQVGQLSFSDFVASVNDATDELIAGNRDLVPDRSWVFEGLWDHQFEDQKSSIRTRLFYHLIQDVIGQTFIPGTNVAVNGNIGSGKRYGFELEAALALDWLGISGAILEGSYIRQWSRVSDPFTGEDVPFSSDLQSSINVEFRQDIAALNLFYGVTYAKNGPRTIREIDEIRAFRFGHFVNAFVEYRFPWFTLRFDGKNIAGEGSRRVRELYTGPRGVSVLDTIRFREQQPGREFKLSVRGSF